MFLRRLGSGPLVVLEPALGSSSPEWWPLQERLAAHVATLSYDRAGYGRSDAGPFPRTSRQIAGELAALLDAQGISAPVILVGHSQGGLYARHFAQIFPHRVAGAVFLDPVSPEDSRWRRELSDELFRGSGADKRPGMKPLRALGRLRLLWAFKPLIRRGPPFYYYRGLDEPTIDLLWNDLKRVSMHEAVWDEYEQAHRDENEAELRGRHGFIAGPVKVVVHDPELLEAEIRKYGGLTAEQAKQVEEFWRGLMREYLALSSDSEWREAPGSSHFVHLGRPELVEAAILDVAATIRG